MAHKRIAVIGNPGTITDSFQKPTEQLFKECGLNTGNLAFWYAMNSHIEGEKSFLGWGTDPQYLRENFDLVVFPAANQLNPDWDMGGLARLFEKADLPLLICGLGVQAPSFDSQLRFNEGSKRFMKVISERAVKIGVRGNFTAEVLMQHGIDNVEVIGCPSNFISHNSGLGQENHTKLKSLRKIDSLVLNLDVTGKLKDLVQTCFEWSRGRRAMFVHQAPEIMVKIANDNVSSIPLQTLNHIKDLMCPRVTPQDFATLVKRDFTVFFDTTEWMHQVQKMDLSVGTRMHGNMLAWQAGVPSILFPHDSRTLELAQVMALPHVHASEVKPCQSIESILDTLQFCGSDYDEKRKLLVSRYTDLLTQTNVQLSSNLENLNAALEKKQIPKVA